MFSDLTFGNIDKLMSRESYEPTSHASVEHLLGGEYKGHHPTAFGRVVLYFLTTTH
jgi:hypothetical protein